MTEGLAIGLAAVAGILFAVLGTAYRLGQSRGVLLVNIVLVSGVLGGLFFGLQAIPLLAAAPWRVYGWGVSAGFTQYYCIKGIASALRRGPLSPVWCAMNLAFVPVIVFAYLGFGEAVGPMQAAAIASAIACVVVASLGPRRTRHIDIQELKANPDFRPAPAPVGAKLFYAAVLLLILASNGVTNMALKALNVSSAGTASDMDLYRNVFLACLYLSLAVAVGAEILFSKRSLAPLRWTLGLGAMAAGGSIGGLSLLAICAKWAAADIFPAVGVSSILAAAAISVAALGEKVNWIWLVTLALGILSVVLVVL